MRKQIAAANWKMNLTLQQGVELIGNILKNNISLSDQRQTLFAVPFPFLQAAQQAIDAHPHYFIAAQNCHFQKSGAFTGEVSAEMLASIGIRYVIVGHSERREYFSESNQILAEKINRCLENQLKPIFCCGESLAVREAGNQNQYVSTQLHESLFHLTADQVRNFIIAYEPIWAIGTGKTASSAQAQEMHLHIRSVIEKQYSSEIASSVSILYGGSVKANNAREIFGETDVDGGLVGGASLAAEEFSSIIRSLQ
ncbi:MAG: triose-phosphate isomerase [Ginsengibacter sp.]